MQQKMNVILIKGYDKDYTISDSGEVYSLKRNKVLSPTTTGAGYKQVSLFKNGKRKCHLVHHLVFNL